MTRKNKPVGEDDLTAYVDGELPDERRAFVEQWLTQHPAEQRQILADQKVRHRLKSTLDPLADTSLPSRFRMQQIRQDRNRRHMTQLQRLAAVLAIVVVSGGGGWLLRGTIAGGPALGTETRMALAAHAVFVPEKLHPVEVSADARDHLGTWLGNRIGQTVAVPDLSAQGLTLLGGRLLPGEGGEPAGQLMYETAGGERVTLYLQRGVGAESAFVFAQQKGVGTLAWRSPELSYILTGALQQQELLGIAHAVHSRKL